MFYHIRDLINEIVIDEPNPSAANALQEELGGPIGEMQTMMRRHPERRVYSKFQINYKPK